MAFEWGKAIPVKVTETIKSNKLFTKHTHVPDKIYTQVHRYRVVGTRSTISPSKMKKLVDDMKKRFVGKATVLYIKVDEIKNNVTVQYKPIRSFILPIIPLIVAMKIIAIAVLLILAIILIFGMVFIGKEAVDEAAEAMNWFVPVMLAGGAGIGAYYLLMKPETVGKVYRGAEQRFISTSKAVQHGGY